MERILPGQNPGEAPAWNYRQGVQNPAMEEGCQRKEDVKEGLHSNITCGEDTLMELTVLG